MSRTLTEAHLVALAIADRFESLPPKVNRMELADAIEILQCALNLTSTEVIYFRLACRNTPEAFWRDGHEPVFGWSRLRVARTMKLDERTISRIETSLVTKGLVVHRDGPTMRRHGGTRWYAGKGVSLAPAAARFDELRARARAAIDEDRRWEEARVSIYSGKSFLDGVLKRDDILPEVAETVMALMRDIPVRMQARMSLDELEPLAARVNNLVARLTELFGVPSMSSACDIHVRPETEPDSPNQRAAGDAGEIALVVETAADAGIPVAVARKVVGDRGLERTRRALSGLEARLRQTNAPVRSPVAYFQWLIANDSHSASRTRQSC
ncbi:MAG: hypothetical protein DI556_13340 [Rhodovulum sulfidophilum]|uniref:Plasmid replication protein C N-terminal domain-containing protein n=1 Tax=Rhodovulum sulfidophilum TaxID=35806 RepID=A0A2W5Q230_RHOSU|nr:MAG: hypothetical protein DI556_13340 [Rhodovulum sulfidophilum]